MKDYPIVGARIDFSDKEIPEGHQHTLDLQQTKDFARTGVFPSELVRESLDSVLPWEWSEDIFHRPIAKFKAGDIPYQVSFYEVNGHWKVSFHALLKGNERFGNFDETGTGNAAAVFSTVLAVIGHFIKERNPDSLSFDGDKGSGRAKLYWMMLKRYASWLQQHGYGLHAPSDEGSEFRFKIAKSKTGQIPNPMVKESEMTNEFWYHPETKQTVPVVGTSHMDTVLSGHLGFEYPFGKKSPNTYAITEKGWVRGRFNPHQFQYGVLSIEGLKKNAWLAARNFVEKSPIKTLYLDEHDGEHVSLSGQRLERYLKTGKIPSSLVREAREGFLYHWMSAQKAVNVFSTDTLSGQWEHFDELQGRNITGTSTSRNEHSPTRPGDCVRLVIDKSKITNNKIAPINAERAFDLSRDRRPKDDRIGKRYHQFAEEFIIGDLSPLHKYLVRIDMAKDQLSMSSTDIEETIARYSKKWNIPVQKASHQYNHKTSTFKTVVESKIIPMRDYGFNVYVNPSGREIATRIEEARDKRLRGIFDDNDMYVWDAYKGTHYGVAKLLGLPWEGVMQLMFYPGAERAGYDLATPSKFGFLVGDSVDYLPPMMARRIGVTVSPPHPDAPIGITEKAIKVKSLAERAKELLIQKWKPRFLTARKEWLAGRWDGEAPEEQQESVVKFITNGLYPVLEKIAEEFGKPELTLVPGKVHAVTKQSGAQFSPPYEGQPWGAISLHPDFYEVLQAMKAINDDYLNLFDRLVDVTVHNIVHEMIHYYQHLGYYKGAGDDYHYTKLSKIVRGPKTKREFKDREAQKRFQKKMKANPIAYTGRQVEVGAHAFNTAKHLLDLTNGSLEKARAYLRDSSKWEDINVGIGYLWRYFNTVKPHSKDAWNKFLKMTNFYLDELAGVNEAEEYPVRSNSVQVHKVRNKAQLRELVQHSAEKILRGFLLDRRNMVVWDAALAIHNDIWPYFPEENYHEVVPLTIDSQHIEISEPSVNHEDAQDWQIFQRLSGWRVVACDSIRDVRVKIQ